MSTPDPNPRPVPKLVSDFAADADMQDIVQMFITEMPGRISAMQKCFAERQASDLTRLAHQLRGAAGGYGFPTITTQAAQLEDRLRALNPSSNPPLEVLRDEFERLIDLCRRATAA